MLRDESDRAKRGGGGGGREARVLPAVPEVRAVRVNTDRAAAERQRQRHGSAERGCRGRGRVRRGRQYDRPKPRLHAFCRGRGVCTGHLLAIETQHVSAAGRQNNSPGRRQRRAAHGSDADLLVLNKIGRMSSLV